MVYRLFNVSNIQYILDNTLLHNCSFNLYLTHHRLEQNRYLSEQDLVSLQSGLLRQSSHSEYEKYAVGSHDDVSECSTPVSIQLQDLGSIIFACEQVQHTHLHHHARPLENMLRKAYTH